YNGDKALAVFDGYPDLNDKNIKPAERERRRRKCSSVFVVFDGTVLAAMAKERFMSNERNKMLSDAAIIVGEEVDLLILLTAAAPVFSKIYLLKPEKGKQADMFYSPLDFKYFDKKAMTIVSKPDGIQDKVTLYSGSSKMLLKEIRYGVFNTAFVKKEFNLASLSRTEAAALQHSL
ncbi:hypothetical protein ILUMI_17191, partial [Ignelater luminosus]